MVGAAEPGIEPPLVPSEAEGALLQSVAEEPLPEALLLAQSHYPWPVVAEAARKSLRERLPALAPVVGNYQEAVFGLSSGFFYLPVAQAVAWGAADEAVLRDLLRALALGHFHFAWQDCVIDEGVVDPIMCLLADAGLLGYLDALEALGGCRGPRYRELHDAYYATYASAIMRDLRHREGLVSYDAVDVLRLGDKAAPGVTVMHIIADMTGRQASGEPAAGALLRLCTGLQLLDDQADAARDAVAGNMTWPVTTALQAYPDLATDDAQGVRAAIVASGAAAACFRVAGQAFRAARQQAESAHALVLADLAHVWSHRCAARSAALFAAGDVAVAPDLVR